MPSNCEGCGHCCHDMGKMFGFLSDAFQFQFVGNTLYYHEKLEELNSDRRKGLHVYIVGAGDNPEIRMTMRGYCTAFNHNNGLCNAHDPTMLPTICQNLLIASAHCLESRRKNDIRD